MNARLLALLAGLSLSTGLAHAATVTQWVQGVSEAGGWYDANKTDSFTTNDSDSYLCWAATAANMINWWQHQFTVIPPDAPTGDAIWQTFRSSWTNNGATAMVGMAWWMTGSAYSGLAKDAIPSGWATLKDTATKTGYYTRTTLPAESITPTFSFTGSQLNMMPGKNSIYGGLWSSSNGTMETLRNQFLWACENKGVCGLGLSFDLYPNMGHAITWWGMEYDDTTGTITRLWVTDSDDTRGQTGEVKMAGRIYPLKVTTDTTTGKLMLTSDDIYAKDIYTTGLGASISGATVLVSNITFELPEPATATLGLLGLAAFLLRRRRA